MRVYPHGEKKFRAEFTRVSRKYTHEGESKLPLGVEESHFYWTEEGAAFNLGGIS